MGYLLLAFVAFLGFVASLGCHVMAWLRIEPPFGKTSMMLHFGLFVVIVPLIILIKRTMPASVDKKDEIKHVFSELPKWIGAVPLALFFYVMASGAYTYHLILQYPRHEAPFYLVLRGFSGIWMMFFGVSALGFVGLFRLSRKKNAAATDATHPDQ